MTPRKTPEQRLKMGRPSQMTKEALDKLEQAFCIGCSDKEACLFANVSEDALYIYQRKHPDFVKRKELLKEKPLLKARNTVVNSLGDAENARWYLERKRKIEFATRSELTGSGGEPLNIKVIKYE